MPLPTDTTLSLVGFSRPGETAQSRPKQAMLIRMSDKTLDLLESSPQLHFEFSDTPGITIGDTFFPVNPVAETTPHEIYLRTSSQAKPNAPLKLYANVTGRFSVERQLDDRMSDKVRNSNIDAQNQRAGRTTIFVKTPTDLPPPNGKKKDGAASTMFRKPIRPADQPRSQPTPNAVTSSSTASTPQQSQRSKEALRALRNRMIPCICTSHRTSEQIIKLVGGNNCSSATRQDIVKLLGEIAEPTPLPTNSKSPKTYRLKTESWLEVRPYEIPGLSEADRTSLARSARNALRDLKIPESDPAWSHVQYRNPNGASSSSTNRKQHPNAAGSSRSGQTPEVKRGITSGGAKEKKAKTRDSGEIMMKNESLKASSSKVPTNGAPDDDSGKSLPFKPPTTHRPGSGFKAKQPTPTESREFTSGRSPIINGKAVLGEPSSGSQNKTSGSTQSAERRTAGLPSQKIKKLRKEDVALSDSERSDLGREKAIKGKDRNKEDKERERKELVNDKRELERQRERQRAKKREADVDGDRERTKKRARDSERVQEREEGEHSDDSFRQQQRKKRHREDIDTEAFRTSIKKRKVESPILGDVKVEGLSLPKKPDTEPTQRHSNIQKEPSPLPSIPKIKKDASPLVPFAKIKKEPSPLTSLPKIKKEPTPTLKVSSPVTRFSPTVSTSSTQLTNSKQKVSTKRRRGSDIYTSSEDEGEIRQETKRDAVANNNTVTHPNKPPPTHDRAALRNHYDTSYIPYLDKFQVLMSQKLKLRNLLKKAEKSSSDSVTESEEDGELLEPEELQKLALEYQDQHGDLENIQRVFSKRDDRSEL